MDPRQIRHKSIESARQLGVQVIATLPLLEAGLHVRSTGRVISRILAMNAVAATAYGFNRSRAIAWLDQEGLTKALSEDEKSFIFEGEGQPDRFKLQVEGMWALAWAMGTTNGVSFAEDCGNGFVTMLPNLKESQSSADFRKRANPRPIEQIAAACDLAYCLHWAIRQSERGGKWPAGALKSYVVIERRRALEWLISEGAWDDVLLDT